MAGCDGTGTAWRGWRRPLLALAVLAVGLAALSSAPAASGPPPFLRTPKLFGTAEIRSTNFKPFEKWTGAVERYSKEQAARGDGDCSSKTFNNCHYEKWQSFLKGMEGKPPMEQVKAVNTFMNEAKYITDPVNWGVSDYWATPGEFLAKFGDCEDYAIAKYMSLKQLGFEQDKLRVVAVKDLNLKIGHAILAVYLDDKIYILDNQIKQVVEDSTIRHYEPVFSINESYWWRHRR